MTDATENPYAAPEADLEIRRDHCDLSVFPRFSTWFVVLLSCVTLGIYAFWWIYDRTGKLNSISEEKVSMNLVKAYIILGAAGTFLPIIFALLMSNSSGAFILVSLLGNLLSFASVVLLVVWAFKFRNCLNRMTASEGQDTWAGGAMTFFFTMAYMSYKINQHLDRRS